MSMLDWNTKAFDRIHPANIGKALCRLGIPAAMCEMIEAICSDREITILDHTGASNKRRWNVVIRRKVSILSPYLFIAIQPVLLHDIFEASKGRERTWSNPMSSKQLESCHEIDNFSCLFS